MTRGHVAYRDALEDLTWMKPKNATEHLESLHVIFAVAISEGLLDQNPFSGVKVRPSMGAFIARRQGFTEEHVKVIFDALKPEPDYFAWVVRLLAYHGLRSGEACQLRCSDVTVRRSSTSEPPTLTPKIGSRPGQPGGFLLFKWPRSALRAPCSAPVSGPSLGEWAATHASFRIGNVAANVLGPHDAELAKSWIPLPAKSPSPGRRGAAARAESERRRARRADLLRRDGGDPWAPGAPTVTPA